MKTASLLLFLLALLATRPAAAQTPAAPDLLAQPVNTSLDYLTDAMRLSQHQRRQVAALLAEQGRHPEQPVPPATWLRVLSLRQYQLWQAADESLPEATPRALPAEVLLTKRSE